LGENEQASFKKTDNRFQKIVWFYVCEVYYGDDFFDKTVHGEISETEEGPTYDIYWFGESMW
jgi:hypothetical protein